MQLTEERLPAGSVDAVGFSLGGKLLLWLEASQPGRFRRLVIGGVGGNIFRPESGAMITAALAAGGAGYPTVIGEVVAEARASGNDLQAIAAVIRRPGVPPPPEALSAIQAEVLLVHGDQDLIGEDAAVLREAIRHAHRQTLAGTGHLDLPASVSFGEMAAAFLLRRPASPVT